MINDARVPAARVSGIYGGLVKMATRTMLGSVPESVAVAWQHPPAFKALMGLGRRSEKWRELPPDLTTYAAMSAAATIGCGACLDLNYFLSRRKGVEERKAQQVPRWRESDVFTLLERQVMEYAEAMCQLPPAVTDEMSAALLQKLGAPGLVELTARVAMMNLTARMNVTLGIRGEGFAESCGLPPLPVDGVGAGAREGAG